jgi:hypothetical protein
MREQEKPGEWFAVRFYCADCLGTRLNRTLEFGVKGKALRDNRRDSGFKPEVFVPARYLQCAGKGCHGFLVSTCFVV